MGSVQQSHTHLNEQNCQQKRKKVIKWVHFVFGKTSMNEMMEHTNGHDRTK